MARPKKQIDFEQVEILCSMQCTGEEIAAVKTGFFKGVIPEITFFDFMKEIRG